MSPSPPSPEGEREAAQRIVEMAKDAGKFRHLLEELNAWGPSIARAYLDLLRASAPPDGVRDALEAAIYEVDKELENGSPEYTWCDGERAVDDARIRAIEAIRALSLSPDGSSPHKEQT